MNEPQPETSPAPQDEPLMPAPETIDPWAHTLIFRASREASQAEQAAVAARGAYEFVYRALAERYALGAGDAIEDDGTITRRPAIIAPDASATAVGAPP